MITKVLNCYLFLLIFVYFTKSETLPRVVTDYGTYIGHILKTRNGRDIYAYQGIPYAKPPVGDFRFADPRPLDKSSDVVYANKSGNICFQQTYITESDSEVIINFDKGYMGSEDCLFLNVYVPEVGNKDKKLPVMVYFHGGGFILGSGSLEFNGPELFLDRDIIMVTPNYRLSVLGFLSVDDEIPENLGLKDQYVALKWVKENIGQFGGDPDAITLAGLSAGSASVTLHHYSKLSRGLFRGGIAQSGSLFSPWVLRSKHEARTVGSKIIKYLGCSSETKQLAKCLKKMPVNELFDAVKSLETHKVGFYMPFGPVIEKESLSSFITKKSIEEGSTVPLLTGVTNEEAAGIFIHMVMADPSFEDLSLLKSNSKNILPIILYYPEIRNKDEINEALSKYYMDNEWSQDKIVNFIQLLSDRIFNHGLHILAKNYKGKVYQYLWSYVSNNTLLSFPKPPGLENSAGHGDDIPFLISMSIFPLRPLEGEELEFSNYVLDLWSNFVIHGDPTPESKFWKESKGGIHYLEFSRSGHTMKSNMFKERMEFLDVLKIDHFDSNHDEL